MIGLRLTDGTTTIYLSHNVTFGGGAAESVHYVPRTPQRERVERSAAGVDGGEVPASGYRNVSEAAEVVWNGPNATVRANLKAAVRLFEAARRRQRYRVGPAVYIEFAADGSDTWYRSEVLDGDIQLADEALDWQWTGGVIQSTVTWVRRFYWEGALTQIPLAHAGQPAGTTGYLQLYNPWDAANARYLHYAYMAAADVAGDLPSPLKLAIYDYYDYLSRRLNYVYISLLAGDTQAVTPSPQYWVIEGEAGTGGSNVEAASCSGGYYKHVTLTGSMANLVTWNLNSNMLAACAGRRVRPIIRFAGNFAEPTWLQLRLMVEVTTLWQSEAIRLNYSYLGAGWHELPIMQLPPILTEYSGAIYPLVLSLAGYSTGGSPILDFDCLALMPLDGWRKCESIGYNLAYNVVLTDDQIDGQMYTEGWASAGKLPNYVARGQPLLVRPNVAHRLHILNMCSAANITAIDAIVGVKAWYRPRRVTL